MSAVVRPALLAGLLLWAGPILAETRRLAVVVGNNAGAPSQLPLRYAENDAAKMARVLVELGDVDARDVWLLQGRRADDVERALREARARIADTRAAPDVRTVMVFFFSGHSDGEAIELGPEKLPYGRLRALLAGTGADVRLAIVDACRSGGGLLLKGGKPGQPFAITLADTLQSSGEAFITSSAADESALESSEVMGSYFTHALISGLRGPADVSGDKQVTLSEAYRYAYERTVSSTSGLSVGAQHPSYDFKLSGQGELVVSNLSRPSAVLQLPDDAERSVVIDVKRDQVVVEVGRGGVGREVALASGDYGVRLFRGAQGYGGRVHLETGQRHQVRWADVVPMSSALVAAKGPGVSASSEAEGASLAGITVAAGLSSRVLVDSLRPSVGPKYQLRVAAAPVPLTLWQRGAVALTLGWHLLGLGEMSFDPPQGAELEGVNEGGLQLRLGGALSLYVGGFTLGLKLEAGGGFLSQLYGPRVASATAVGNAGLTVRFQVSDRLALALDVEAPLQGITFSDAQGSAFRWFSLAAAGAGVVVQW